MLVSGLATVAGNYFARSIGACPSDEPSAKRQVPEVGDLQHSGQRQGVDRGGRGRAGQGEQTELFSRCHCRYDDEHPKWLP